MSRLLRVAFAILFVSILLPVAAQAGDNPPTPYQDSFEGLTYDGRQNYPVKLRGVTIKWYKSCAKGKSEDCLKLAKVFELGWGAVYADQRTAVGLYMEACKKGSAAGCVRAAEMLRDGVPGYKLPEMAQQQVDRGCNQLKYQPACASLAVSQAASAPPGSEQADALLAKACAGGDDTGCRHRANSLFYVRKDAASRAEALKMYEPACQARKSWGCMGMADAYRNGWGVAANAARASEFERTGCIDTSGDKLRLCTYYGERLVSSGNTAQIDKGMDFLNAGCVANDGQACFYAARVGAQHLPGVTVTFQESLYYARRGCELGEGRSCLLLGMVYAGDIDDRNLFGFETDNAVALALFDRGCKLGEQTSCTRAGKLTAGNPGLRNRHPIDPAAPAVKQLEQAKTMVESGNGQTDGLRAVLRLVREGNEDANWLLGNWFYNGVPGLFGLDKQQDGLISIENAARVGHVDAAIFMGMAYWYGQGVEVDQQKGMGYMAIAANRGDRKAEAILASMRAEPIRQENARRAAEFAKWQEYYRTHPTPMFTNSWSAPSASYNPTPTYSGPSVSQIYDQHNFNNAINYYSGKTSVCSSSNRYC